MRWEERGLLTTAEAAKLLRISPRTLERYRVCGTEPVYFKAGPGVRSRVLYDLKSLKAWIRQYKSTSEYGD